MAVLTVSTFNSNNTHEVNSCLKNWVSIKNHSSHLLIANWKQTAIVSTSSAFMAQFTPCPTLALSLFHWTLMLSFVSRLSWRQRGEETPLSLPEKQPGRVKTAFQAVTAGGRGDGSSFSKTVCFPVTCLP